MTNYVIMCVPIWSILLTVLLIRNDLISEEGLGFTFSGVRIM